MITAVTKSGTNRWAGDGFVFFQNKNLVSLDKYSEGAQSREADVRAVAAGLSIGGPIVKDKLFVFGAYEENRQNRDSQVFLGGTPFPPSLDLREFEGTFPSEFRERLALREGDATSRRPARTSTSATACAPSRTCVTSAARPASRRPTTSRTGSTPWLGRWQIPGATWLNELTVTYQRSNWNPEPVNPDLIGQEYVGRHSHRRPRHDAGLRPAAHVDAQRLHPLRKWNGTHTMKAGGVLSFPTTT